MEALTIIGLFALVILLALMTVFLTRELRFERRHNRRLHAHLEQTEMLHASLIKATDDLADCLRHGMRVPEDATLRITESGVTREVGLAAGTYFFKEAETKKELRRAVAEALLERSRAHLSVVPDDGGDPPNGAA